jgi:hypothetical protein
MCRTMPKPGDRILEISNLAKLRDEDKIGKAVGDRDLQTAALE